MKQFSLATFVLFMVFNHAVAQKGYQVAIDLRKVQKDRLAVNIRRPKQLRSISPKSYPAPMPFTIMVYT